MDNNISNGGIMNWTNLLSFWMSKKGNPVSFINKEGIADLVKKIKEVEERAIFDDEHSIIMVFSENPKEYVDQNPRRPRWVLNAGYTASKKEIDKTIKKETIENPEGKIVQTEIDSNTWGSKESEEELPW